MRSMGKNRIQIAHWWAFYVTKEWVKWSTRTAVAMTVQWHSIEGAQWIGIIGYKEGRKDYVFSRWAAAVDLGDGPVVPIERRGPERSRHQLWAMKYERWTRLAVDLRWMIYVPEWKKWDWDVLRPRSTAPSVGHFPIIGWLLPTRLNLLPLDAEYKKKAVNKLDQHVRKIVCYGFFVHR